ncbi:hypothetical protein [Glycomyces harbinensis]|uniref:Uncharacterized protein n=1 Tax=Glycomyces harbinensis TaxID=58114 RepID=A0A1G6TRY4_9ACTN|nr:hypothetical protein [Glycomyces harbinensis]SDD31789.1 hypothetical protein SAMN05216270_103117 [Glycomyces harbinensis]
MATGFAAAAVMAPAGAAVAAEPETKPIIATEHVLEGRDYIGKFWWRSDCDVEGRDRDAASDKYTGHECLQGDTWPYMWNLWMTW